MPDVPGVTRDSILRVLAEALEPLAFVDAMWEGGAAAFERLDEWSDIDLYVVAADDQVAETFRAIEEALRRLSSIRHKYEPAWPPEAGIAQAFYRLEGTNEYLLVDLAILKRSAPDKFLETELHGQARFTFNKGDGVKIPLLDTDAFVRQLLERRDRLAMRMTLFSPFVSKELHRRNALGALEAYQRIVLDSLIQVLRMRHYPAHYSFSVRYVPFELPPDVARRLESLSFVKAADDLPELCSKAVAWFRETAAAVNGAEVRERLARASSEGRTLM